MKTLIALLLISILLFGCLGVDSNTYEKTKTERDAFEAQAKDAAAKVTALQSQCDASQASLSKCSLDLDALRQQCGQTGTACASVQASYDSVASKLALVRNNITALAPYRNAKSLYYEVIKSGKIPGYSRLMASDAAVNATGDLQLEALWKSARDCPRRGGDCTHAYDGFDSYLNSKIDDYISMIIVSANS